MNIRLAQRLAGFTLVHDGDIDAVTRQKVLDYMTREATFAGYNKDMELPLTETAEAAALAFGHDEWLDKDNGDIWDLALLVSELLKRGLV